MKYAWMSGLVMMLIAMPGGGQEDAPKPVALDKLNTDADEVDPFVASNNLILLYASNKDGSFDLRVTQRGATTQAWPAGESSGSLNTKEADERSPVLRGNVLFFATNKVPDAKLEDLKNFDIVQRIAGMAPLPLPGVSEREDEMHPWITPAGREFYFSRKAKDGWKLFVANGPVPGPIGMPKELGFPAGFQHATLSSTGLLMYLEGPIDKDRSGIFRSRRTATTAPWSKPEPIKNLAHAEGGKGDMCPSLSPDGSRLYFASDRPGGKGGLDLYSVPTSQLK